MQQLPAKVLLLLFVFGSHPVFAGETPCTEHVERTYQRRLQALADEGVILKSPQGAYLPTLSEEALFQSPRFRNFPAISSEQIRWCPELKSVELSLDFLAVVGFDRVRLDRYFKRLLHLGKNEELPVLKDQIGPSYGRESFLRWADDQPERLALLRQFALAVLRDPVTAEPLARAGAIYLGNYQDSALYSLPRHALFIKDQIFSCEDFEFIFPTEPQNPVRPQATLLTLAEFDLSICALNLSEEHQDLTPALVTAEPLAKNQPLHTFGLSLVEEQKLRLTIDASPECQTLANSTEMNLYQSGLLPEPSWQLAMGCDVAAGNSGDPVIEPESGAVVGFVTSRSPYVFAQLTSALFNGELSHERLYLESSHFVPFSAVWPKIKQELKCPLECWRELPQSL